MGAHRAVAVLIAVAPLACAAPPNPQATHASRAGYEVRAFSLQKGFVTGTLKIPETPPGPKAAILQPIVDEAELLERGFAVVRFQANWHLLAPLVESDREPQAPPAPAEGSPDADASVGRWLLASARPGLVGSDYFSLISANADGVVPAVLDYLQDVPEIDPRRMAIAGSSTAGFVALEAFVRERRLSAAAVRVACGDYHEFLKSSSLALDGDERWLHDGDLVLDADYEARLREREPIRYAERLPPRPLLMLNGEADPAVPATCARETARVFAASYARRGVPERFRFVLYPDRGHDLGADSAQEVIAWWERWLQPPAGAGRPGGAHRNRPATRKRATVPAWAGSSTESMDATPTSSAPSASSSWPRRRSQPTAT
jgi:dienelactone hydrolase